jgi:hypothetical protein
MEDSLAYVAEERMNNKGEVSRKGGEALICVG